MHIDDMISLAGQTPHAIGSYRAIYDHPDRSDQLIKVLLPAEHRGTQGPIRQFIKGRSVRQLYRFLFREFDCYLDCMIRQPDLGGPLPIARLYGMVQTDIGPGMIVEKVHDGDGGVGKSLKTLHQTNGLSDDQLHQLNHFIAEIYRWGFVANDTNPGNIIYDESSETPRFVLVDGFGDAHFIPLRSWFESQRLRGLNSRFSRLAAFLNRTWNPDKRCIED